MSETIQTATPEYHIFRNGVFQFCATHVNVTGGDINYTGDCAAPPVPPNRYTSGRVHYPPRETLGNVVDLTLWENLFGRTATSSAPAVPFPGLSGSNPIINSLPNGGYIAAKFTVPNYDVMGQYKVPPEWSIAGLDFSLSETPGDFNPATALKVVIGPVTYNQTFLHYDTGTTGTYRVHLVKGRTYYLNIRRSAGVQGGVPAIVHQGGQVG